MSCVETSCLGIGRKNFRSPEEDEDLGADPVGQALTAYRFDKAFLITDHQGETVRSYRKWIERRSRGAEPRVPCEQLTGPTDFVEIYVATVPACSMALADKIRAVQLVDVPNYQTLTNWTKRYGMGA